MMGMPKPPAAAERLLVRLLPEEIAESYAGDLEERFALDIVPRAGLRAARLWYWSRVLSTRVFALRRAANRLRLPGSVEPPHHSGIVMDLMHAARALLRERGTSSVIVVTLGIAMAATTLAFTIVDAVLLRPLPYPAADRLVALYSTFDAWRTSDSPMMRQFAERMPVSWPQLKDWEGRSDLFEAVGGYRVVRKPLDGAEDRVNIFEITEGFFPAFAVAPVRGRLPQDGTMEAVISYGSWQGRFGGAADVLGRTIRVGDESFVVVGVMPATFWFYLHTAEVFTPLPASLRIEDRQSAGLSAIARLRAGVSIELAQSELSAQAARVAEQDGHGARVASLRTELVGDVEQTLLILFAAVCFVLLVACTNVANLMLVRSTQRARDLAVRAALGAGRARLLRSVLAEGLLLALVAGTFGIAIARLSLSPLLSLIPASVPRLHEVTLDLRVGMFVLAIAVATALLVGALPGVRASRTSPGGVLREGGRTMLGSRGTRRLQSMLVVGEVAVACVLLVTGVLLATSYYRMLTVERGYDGRGLVVLPLVLPREKYAESEALAAFSARVLERARGIPGVAQVSVASDAPFSGSLRSYRVQIPDAVGGPTGEISVNSPDVDTAFFAALRVPVLAGRTFGADDVSAGANVVIVNRAFARRFWGSDDAVGRVVQVGPPDNSEPHTVIGVVGDMLGDDIREAADARMYTPFAFDGHAQYLIARAQNPPAALSALRAAALELEPELGGQAPYIVEAEFRQRIADPRLRMVLIGALAGIGCLLALLGVYGLLAWRVVSSIPVIGLRMALGAQSRSVEASVVRQGLGLAATGVLMGLVLSLALTRGIRAFLFDIAPTDPLTYAATAAALLLVAALASWLPARRAARVDPVRALMAG